jgi:hypothetical protein
MKADIKKIYEAHVAFELEQYEGKNLEANIKDEVNAAWSWMEKAKLNDISSAQKVKDFLERNLKDRALTKHQKEYLIDLGGGIHELALESKHTLSDFIEKDTYFEIADFLIKQKEAREEIIERIVKNPFYGEMLADTLYDGIKSFAMEGGPSNETIGGSLFNIGKSFVGAALSGVQDNIDKNIKKFISTNLSKAIESSEEKLKKRLNNDKLESMARNIWNKAETIKVKKLARSVKESHIETIVDGGAKVAKDLIAAEAVKELAHFVIDHFFEYDGKKTISAILTDNGITKNTVLKETKESAIPIIESMKKTGYLKERIETKLSRFYETL